MTVMPEGPGLYETDFYAWTRQQAEALRAVAREGSNAPVDYAHVAEEIEDLGRNSRFELRNRLATVIEHLLKLGFSPAVEPRAGWRNTVRRSRDEIAALLEESPSLRRDIPELLAKATRRTADRVAEDLADRGEAAPAEAVRRHGGAFSEAEITGDWFPPPPA